MLSSKYNYFFRYLLNYGDQSDYLIDLIIFDRAIDPFFIKILKEY